jgi:hypothetical protein
MNREYTVDEDSNDDVFGCLRAQIEENMFLAIKFPTQG